MDIRKSGYQEVDIRISDYQAESTTVRHGEPEAR
jgi:hypothetical protein